MRTLLLLAALLSASEWTLAQARTRPDPAKPSTTAPPPSYQSAFSDYQPFRDEKVRSWKDVNQEVADNPGMGSMKHGPGMPMPGMDAKAGDATKGKDGTAGHDMGSMKDKPGKTMPGMDKPSATAPKSKEGHDAMAMAKPQTTPGQTAGIQTARITGTGSVQLVDKANGKVKLTHDPIAAMGWPKMTMFFRLKERSLADQVKEGDKVEFTLEKSASGYVISGFQKSISESNPAVNVPKPAGHGKH
ncbi:MAG: copper-binding protein [Pseudomonadota bacterium]